MYHVILSPELIQIIDNLIYLILTGLATWVSTEIVGLLHKHGILKTAQAQQIVGDELTKVFQRGAVAARDKVDDITNHLSIPVENRAVAAVANYVISTSPDKLKVMGVDMTTEEGQKAVVARAGAAIAARLPPGA